MRIHFIIHGLGFGHYSRMRDIIFRLSKSHEIYVSSFGKIKKIIDKELEGRVEKSFELPEVGLLIEHNGKVDLKRSVMENLKSLHPYFVSKLNAVIKDGDADLFVVDGYPFVIPVLNILKKRVISVSNCTILTHVFSKMTLIDNGFDVFSKYIVEHSDLVVVPDLPPPFTFSLDNINFFGKRNKFLFLGPLIDQKRVSFSKRKKKKIRISFGGSGVNVNYDLSKIIQSFKELGYDIDDNTYQDIDKNRRVINESSFLILHGGHTSLMESLYFSVPSILLPVENYRERMKNSIGAQRQGFGFIADPLSFSPSYLEFLINDFREKIKRMENLSNFSRNLRGVDRFIELIHSFENR